jgi:hypothetical protein
MVEYLVSQMVESLDDVSVEHWELLMVASLVKQQAAS